MKMTVRNIIDAVGGRVAAGSESNLSRVITHIITDTRLLPTDDNIESAAFLALKGENFDGNTFAPAAARLGVGLVICERFEPDNNPSGAIDGAGDTAEADPGTVVVVCGDTLDAYGRIAAAHRLAYRGTVIGVTGSVGKTTTKEFIFRAVSALGPASKTKANFNNEIGVPKTVLDIGGENSAVVEMGMRGRGQIEYLVNIVRPDVAVITTVGYAHIELLGTLDNTLRAKLEIASKMRSGGILILNGDDGLLADRENVLAILKESYGVEPEIVYYGTGGNAIVRADNIEAGENQTGFDLWIRGNFVSRVTLMMRGRHNVYAAMAAISVACAMNGFFETVTGNDKISGAESFGAILRSVLPAVSSLRGEDFGRQKVIDAGGVTVIDDCYNAGPESVKAQLEALSMKQPAEGHRRVAVLGDMLELGDESVRLHREVAARAMELGIDRLICVGPLSRNMDAGCFSALFGYAGDAFGAEDAGDAGDAGYAGHAFGAEDAGDAAVTHSKGSNGRPDANCEFFYFDDSAACARRINALTEPGDVVLVKGSHGMHMEKVTEALVSRSRNAALT